MNTHKRDVLIVSIVLAVIFSLLFIVIRPATGIFLVSYIFAIGGLVFFCAATWYMIDHRKKYPWGAALPIVVRNYLIIQLVISAIFVVVEQIAKWSADTIGLIQWINAFHFAPGWYLLIHVVLLLILVIRIVLLLGGADHIEKRDAEVRVKTRFIAELRTNIELLINHTDDAGLKNQLSRLAETVRYSDPMSASALIPIERKMAEKAKELKANLSDIETASTLIEEITLLLEERNARCKGLK